LPPGAPAGRGRCGAMGTQGDRIMPDVIPGRQALKIAYFNNFAGVLNGNPMAYGATVLEATQLMAQTQDLNNAWEGAMDPSTRTRGSIALKDNLLEVVEQHVRGISRRIQANP